jgi:hypothetical protein
MSCRVDWHELSGLYKSAPLGEKPPERLKTVFSNSLYRCFVYHEGRLIGAGRAPQAGEGAGSFCRADSCLVRCCCEQVVHHEARA